MQLPQRRPEVEVRVGLRHGRTDVIERLIDVDVLPPGAAERGVARQHLIANADNLQAGPISQCSYRSMLRLPSRVLEADQWWFWRDEIIC